MDNEDRSPFHGVLGGLDISWLIWVLLSMWLGHLLRCESQFFFEWYLPRLKGEFGLRPLIFLVGTSRKYLEPRKDEITRMTYTPLQEYGYKPAPDFAMTSPVVNGRPTKGAMQIPRKVNDASSVVFSREEVTCGERERLEWHLLSSWKMTTSQLQTLRWLLW